MRIFFPSGADPVVDFSSMWFAEGYHASQILQSPMRWHDFDGHVVDVSGGRYALSSLVVAVVNDLGLVWM